MSQYKIDKNIPIPTGHIRSKYPFASMDVGDSFFVPESHVNTMNALRQSGYRCGNELNAKFLVKKDDGGFRVFRTA